MGFIDQFIPANVRATLDKIFKDQEIRRDLTVVMSEAAPLFEKASQELPSENSLKTVFNDVALVLPLIKRFLDKGKLPGTFELIGLAPTYAPVFKRMYSNPDIDKAFQNPGPELTAVYDKLLDKQHVQEALKRVLLKPTGQDVLTLQEENGKFYAVENLSGGIKFPLREDIYNSVKAARNNNNQPPKGPSGPGV